MGSSSANLDPSGRGEVEAHILRISQVRFVSKLAAGCPVERANCQGTERRPSPRRKAQNQFLPVTIKSTQHPKERETLRCESAYVPQKMISDVFGINLSTEHRDSLTAERYPDHLPVMEVLREHASVVCEPLAKRASGALRQRREANCATEMKLVKERSKCAISVQRYDPLGP